MDTNRLTFLFNEMAHRPLSAMEREELSALWLLPDNEDLAKQLLEQRYDDVQEMALPAVTVDDVYRRILHHVQHRSEPREKSVLLRGWIPYAAVLLVFLGIGVYAYFLKQERLPATVATVQSFEDVQPGQNKAFLVLGDESVVDVDGLQIGESIIQGNMQVTKTANGKLIYSPAQTGSADNKVVFMNTMKTPRGGEYQLTLPDGSQVWLNAASSITYPTIFSVTEREVSISGEAYFDVVPDKSRPFTVNTGSGRIEVLGTSFNVNAYADEPVMRTALVQGSVRVGHIILRPGQVYAGKKIITDNLSQDVAWKNGVFAFADADIKAVMRQLSRWYDIDVQFRGKVPAGEFSGEIGRNLTLHKVLNRLSSNYGFRYHMENKTIVIEE